MSDLHVTVIIPSTHDRFGFNENILRQFYGQDYPNKSVSMDLGPGTVGAKRNGLCKKAIGDIIIHMDSDDNYATDWISKSVEAILGSGADIVGLKNFYLKDLATGDKYLYTFPADRILRPWVAGATMCYWRKYWLEHPFADLQSGEDNRFIWSNREVKVFAHDYIDGFLASVHKGNTSKGKLGSPEYKKIW